MPKEFHAGKLSTAVKQKMDYYKTKHRTGMLLKNWHKDQYWFKQDKVLQDDFTDNIDRVDINKISYEEF